MYEFTKMPFALCNTPSMFQRVCSEYYLEELLCYINDVLVASKTLEEHLEHLREMFYRLLDFG